MSFIRQKLRDIERGREAERIYRKERELATGQAERDIRYRQAVLKGKVRAITPSKARRLFGWTKSQTQAFFAEKPKRKRTSRGRR